MLIKTNNGDQLRGDRNLDSLVDLLLLKLQKNFLLSIGDSHSRLFSDLSKVKICHIGPVTAFNLVQDNSSTKGREKLYNILDNTNPSDAAIILSFGEIDMRVHVIKAAIKENITIKESSIRTAKNYCSVISEILHLGFSVLIQGIHASSSIYNNYHFPTVGRVEDRNYAVKQFNKYLKKFCTYKSIPYASLDDIVVTQDLRTRNEYMSDGCHLNFNPEIQAILLYGFIDSLLCNYYDEHDTSDRIIDISRNKPYTLTSSYDGKPKGVVCSKNPYFFHTNIGHNQGILIDLQAKFILDHIRLVNRQDICYDRSHSLYIVMYDMNNEIYRTNIPDDPYFLSPGGSIEIKLPEHLTASRIALFSVANTYLHLSDINIYAYVPSRS